MKRLLLIFLLLLIASPAYPFGTAMTAVCSSGGGAAAAATDSCTGGLLFSWHCENVDVTLGGVAGGVNNGCSAGYTTATANSSAAINADHTAQDGTNHCDFPTASDRYLFTVSSNDIANPAAGTVIFYLKLQTPLQYNGLFRLYADANDYLKIAISTADKDELTLSYSGNGTIKTITTSGINMTTGVWYKITAKWSVAGVSEGGTKYLSIDVDDATGTRAYGTAALTAFTDALGTDGLQFGETDGYASDFQIDNIKVYDSWLTTP